MLQFPSAKPTHLTWQKRRVLITDPVTEIYYWLRFLLSSCTEPESSRSKLESQPIQPGKRIHPAQGLVGQPSLILQISARNLVQRGLWNDAMIKTILRQYIAWWKTALFKRDTWGTVTSFLCWIVLLKTKLVSICNLKPVLWFVFMLSWKAGIGVQLLREIEWHSKSLQSLNIVIRNM